MTDCKRESRYLDSPQRLVTVELDGSITTLTPRLKPCQAEALRGFLKTVSKAKLRVLPLTREVAQ
jgi:hypothetical protein